MASPAKSCRSSILDRAQEWRVLGESMIESLVDFCLGIESREQTLRSVEMKFGDLEEREMKLEELKVSQEGRSVELKLREEKLDGLLKLSHEHIEKLESSQSEVECLRWKEWEKLKEIEEKEIELDVLGALLEKRLNEVEMREKEFEAFHRRKSEELALKEEVLFKVRQKLVDEVKLWYHGFFERTEKAEASLGRMKAMMDERFEEIESREAMAHESIIRKLNEADLIRLSLEKRFKELENFEKELNSSQQDKLEELDTELKQGDLKENLELSEGLVKGEVERKRKRVQFIEQGLKQKILMDTTNAHLTAEKPLNLEQKDKKSLEKFVNDPEKVLELKDGEVYRILKLSADPAKLVLDAVQGFSAEPHSRRASIILLGQLTKISPKIQPCVAVAATVFAFRWKSKMCVTSADPKEVLGFLHLLAAFGLSARFNKDELFGFLKVVGRDERTPGLCRALGLAEKIPGYVQDLINGKEFLLASTYIHEFQLQSMWKQSTILNHYVTNAKARIGNQPKASNSELLLKAVASEISNLRIAIQHIEKYGLESAYSPHTLRARILQLEANQASLRPANPSSSPADAKRDRRSRASPAMGKCPASSRQSGFRARVDQVPRPHPGPDGPHKRHKPNVGVDKDQFAR